MKKLIIFICNGNIHRSVIAAECLHNSFEKNGVESKFLIDSYGLQGTCGTDLPKHKHLSEYLKEWKAAKPTLERLGIDISKHSFQKVSVDVMEKANIVIAMDNKVYSEEKNSLMNQFPDQAHKIHLFSKLTLNHKTIKDLAGIEDEYLYKEIIEDIHSTLNTEYKKILDWIK